MKITTMFTKIISRGFAIAAVFALVTAPVAPVFAQSYGYDYDYGDGYSYDYPSYDYGYDYDYGDGYSYDYPSYDYGYDYDYGDGYSYDYPDYSYNYDYDYGDQYQYEYPVYQYADDYTYEYPTYDGYQPPVYQPPVYQPPVWDPPVYNPPPVYQPPVYQPPVWDPPVYNPPTYSQPTCTLDASDNSIDDGDDFTLSWDTTNATYVTITTLGFVNPDGSAVLSPKNSMTYTLVASGPGGSVTCTEQVTVHHDTTPDNSNVRCDAFTASDSRVDRGDSVTLRWNTTDADSVRIDNGVGSVSEDGSTNVRVYDDTTYTLTARNGSDEDTCRVTVRVENTTTTGEVPRCRLNISDTQITSGQAVTVSWDNLNTDRAILRDNHGNTIGDSSSYNNINEDRDSRVFRPTQSTDYTLTVYNGNTTRTCTVGTQVTGGVVLNGTRGQDGIYLSQVPYTGFEAGPVLTFVFYGAIGLWGAAIAYALVMKKAAIATVATAVAHTPVTTALAASAGTVATATTEVAHAPSNLPGAEVVAGEDEVVASPIELLERQAHAQQALISGEALAYLAEQYGVDASEKLDQAIAQAHTQFPKEEGWVVLNKEKLMSVLG